MKCGSPFSLDEGGDVVVLRCVGCHDIIQIQHGIARFVEEDDSEDADVASRTRRSFGYEWTHFNDWRDSGDTNFEDYFSGLDREWLRGRRVLDAGCGMGRHARHVAGLAEAVVAMDFSAAIDQAARNVADLTNVYCIQADLTNPPIADEVFDLVYSIGVLHHLEDAEGALRRLMRALKPGGRLRIYVYWKRGGAWGLVLRLVSVIRRLTTRLPFGVLRALTWLLAAVLYLVVVVPYKILARKGTQLGDTWPLVVYAKYPFAVLHNDQFDRFSAPIEKRYAASEVRTLLERVGLVQVQVIPRFGWIADGLKPDLQKLAVELNEVPLETIQSKT